MIKTKRIFSFVSALVLTFSALAVWAPQKALAATRTWDGGGSDENWSTAANWSSDTAPVNGDTVTFDVSVLSAHTHTNNDLSNLSLAGINRTGNSASNYSLYIEGNGITLTSPVTGSSGSGFLYLDIDITLGANLTLSATDGVGYFGGSDDDFSLGSYTLTVEDTVFINATLAGTGNITIGDEGFLQLTSNVTNTYTGDVSATGRLSIGNPKALGAGTSITVSGGGNIEFPFNNDGNFLAPITIGGTGNFTGYSLITGDGFSKPVVLAGGVTLTSNITAQITKDLTIEEPFTTNGYTITPSGDSTGTIHLPGGDVQVEAKTVTIVADDKQPSKGETIGNKQVYIIDGERGAVTVANGGVLKGLGKVGWLQVSGGGLVAPGHSPGRLTVLNNLGLSEGSTYEVELKTKDDYDQLIVGEDYTLATAVTLGNATLKGLIADGFKIAATDTFTIIDNKHTSAVSGTFKDLPEGATFKISDGVFKISYVGGDGNDVVLSVVTVPKTPSSGFFLSFSNPYVVLAAAIAVAGAAFYLTRRYAFAKTK